MFGKFIKATLLIMLIAFYAINIMESGNYWLTDVLYNRLNFVLLVAILFLASDFIRPLALVCIAVLAGGILFHGYMYYKAYTSVDKSWEGSLPEAKKCQGKGVNWYTKLNDSCY